MQQIETRGLVLYNQNFREDDKLVKIFTEHSGKRMFFVKHISKSRLTAGIQPLSFADFIVKINDSGLCYIDDIQHIRTFPKIQEDIFTLSYASYLISLADACLEDGIVDESLLAFLETLLELMEEGLDAEVLTNIFEIQILSRFGVSLNFHECLFCHRVGLPFDYSFRFSGVLCPEHYHKDSRRSHLDPNVLYLLDQFQTISFSELKTISLKSDIKQKLRVFIDQIYEEYVGIHLKSKKFIDELSNWGDIFKK